MPAVLEYFFNKFLRVFHQSKLELSDSDENWAKTSPLHLQIFQSSNCVDSRIVHCVSSNVPSNCLPERTWIRACKVTLVAFVWLFSTVCLQMCPQIACIRGCIITQVAFVWFFSTVCLQMCPQITRLIGCKITQVTFVWLFSTVCFQVCPQIACLRWCIITLAAFVWLFSTVRFQMFP